MSIMNDIIQKQDKEIERLKKRPSFRKVKKVCLHASYDGKYCYDYKRNPSEKCNERKCPLFK